MTQKVIQEQEEVELAKPHTHAGKRCQPGDKIKVAPAIAAWLRDQRIAKPAADTAVAVKKETK